MRPLSISTALFDGFPLERGFAEIASTGIRFVEPAFIKGYIDFDESVFSEKSAIALSSAMAAAGLETFAVSAHHDMGAVEAAEATIRRLRFARNIGARILITNATTESQREQFQRNLNDVLPVCEDTGIVIALENPGHGEGDLIASGAAGARLIQSIGSRHLRLNYDFANALTYSHERIKPEHDFEAALPAMAHAHLKDVLTSVDGWRFTALGEGSIGLGEIWRQLARLAPNLPVGIELPLRLARPGRAAPRRATSPMPIETLRDALIRSLDFLKTAETGQS